MAEVRKSSSVRHGNTRVQDLGMLTLEEAKAYGKAPTPPPVPVPPDPPAPPPAPPPVPPSPPPVVGRTPLDFGAKGDGFTDDSAALQRFFDATGDLAFPTAMTFAYSTPLYIRQSGKAIEGNGALLLALTLQSMIEIQSVRDIQVRGLKVQGKAIARVNYQNQNGWNVKDSHNVTLEECEAWDVGRNLFNVINARKGAPHCTNIKILRCKGGRSQADGIRIEGGDDCLVEGCAVSDTGDDALASIGYVENGPNLRPVFRNNDVNGTRWARGLAMEGTLDGLAVSNRIRDTMHAGMICQSTPTYPTGISRVIYLNNEVVNCAKTTGPEKGQGGIHGAANGFDIFMVIQDNRITSLPDRAPINTVGYNGFSARVTKLGNTNNGQPI